jgi:hypothetical protein
MEIETGSTLLERNLWSTYFGRGCGPVGRRLLLLLALQPTVDFGLLSDSLPFCSFFTFLSPL